VYVEKPLGHNIREGRAVIDGAREHGRVVQVGLQQRSGAHWQSAVERIRGGELGRVSMVHAWNAWNMREMFGYFGKQPDAPAPRGVNYDLWLGPAPKRPFNSARFHGLWYFFWDYAGGMVSGWGVHLFDVVAWALGYGVESVSMTGAKLILDDDRETPDTAAAVFNCPGFIMHYTMRHANGWRPHGDMDHGIQFFGEEATLQVNRAGFQMYRETDRGTRKPYYSEEARTHDYREHLLDFFAAIRSRGKTRCDAEAGHQAAVYPHLANISYRVGRTVNWDAQSETIPHDPVAGALLTREYRDPWQL
jgi:predicted dehydrogenase